MERVMDPRHLEEYLKYMGQLGLEGLALEKNPFTRVAAPAPKPRLVVDNRRTAPIPASAERPAAPISGPDLFDIMAEVEQTMSGETTRSIVDAVTGETEIEVLRNLYKTFRGCEACALGTTRRSFVFGEGHPTADLMFVGEGPGEDEDLSGRPFVGKAGRLLDRIIEAMSLKRGDVFIANVVKCRPPGNRSPLPDEVATCTPILIRQIETVQPRVIVALGATAFRFFKGGNVSITRGRGRTFEWHGHTVMPTFHPAYVLRNPRAKREVWEDMKQVMSLLT